MEMNRPNPSIANRGNVFGFLLFFFWEFIPSIRGNVEPQEKENETRERSAFILVFSTRNDTLHITAAILIALSSCSCFLSFSCVTSVPVHRTISKSSVVRQLYGSKMVVIEIVFCGLDVPHVNESKYHYTFVHG